MNETLFDQIEDSERVIKSQKPKGEPPPVLTDIVQAAPPTDSSAVSLPNLLKAAGDSFRLDVLRVLAQDSFGVLELCRIFSAKQSGMSHHLKVLTNAGLV
ncbi:MAG: ArsR family transcriptional regulator, partial [Moraxellaceae bacterium]